MNTYEELAVLEQGEDGAVVSIRGQGGPCVLLGPAYLGHLGALLGQVSEGSLDELKADACHQPLVTLCSEMRMLLKVYDDTCNKFSGSVPATKTLAQIQDELDAMAKQLSRF